MRRSIRWRGRLGSLRMLWKGMDAGLGSDPHLISDAACHVVYA